MNLIENVGKQLLNTIGRNGPTILFFLSIYLLWNKPTLLFYYIIGLFVSYMLNYVLKGFFQQLRPNEEAEKVNLILNNRENFLFHKGFSFDSFGMPSSHTQSVLFSTIFIYMACRKSNMLFVYILICFITFFNRFINNYHTLFQILVGGIIGLVFGYFVFILSQSKLKGIFREKKDDNVFNL